VTQNIPDEKGIIDYTKWEWIDFNGDGKYLGKLNDGELNAAGLGNGTTDIPNLFITGPNNYSRTNTMGIEGFWRVRPPKDAWGEYFVELRMDSNLEATAQAIGNTGLVKVLPNEKNKNVNTKITISNSQTSTICGVTNKNPQSTLLSPENKVNLDLDFGILCKEFGAVDDEYSNIDCTSTGMIGNVLSNDLLNGIYVAADLITFSVPSEVSPNVTIDNLGNITVTSGIASGTYTYNYKLCDKLNADNCVSATITINVQDTKAPVIATLPEPKTISCDVTPTFEQATATDGCSVVTLTYNDVKVNGNCDGSYTITRTWRAIDASNNISVASQVINVQDTNGPTASTVFATSIDVSCDAIPTVPELVFIDNCSEITPAVFTEQIINSTQNSYSIVRKWIVSDTCGNSSEFSQVVNVSIANSVTTIAGEACNSDSSTINLFNLLPEGTPVNGVWIDLNNSGALQGNIITPLGIALGNYAFEYKIADESCPRSIVLNININNECFVLDCGTITVHNAFSPNGDQFNQKFIIENIDDTVCYPENTVEIYNRWGVLVFETKNYNNETNYFDGNSKGRTTISQSSNLPTGTYFYILNWTSLDSNNNTVTNKKDGYLYLTK
jgi:gliding motility-associated-like protein